MTFGELAALIAQLALYRKRNGDAAGASQLRLRATESGGHYVHFFEVAGSRIRLPRT